MDALALNPYFQYAVVLVFVLAGVGFVVMNVNLLSRLLRAQVPDPAKQTTYECGEPPVGPNWVQFDLRFYNVALLFLVFDVEVAFLLPWAACFGRADAGRLPALVEAGVFLLVLTVGLVFAWRKGDLDWVKPAGRMISVR